MIQTHVFDNTVRFHRLLPKLCGSTAFSWARGSTLSVNLDTISTETVVPCNHGVSRGDFQGPRIHMSFIKKSVDIY